MFKILFLFIILIGSQQKSVAIGAFTYGLDGNYTNQLNNALYNQIEYTLQFSISTINIPKTEMNQFLLNFTTDVLKEWSLKNIGYLHTAQAIVQSVTKVTLSPENEYLLLAFSLQLIENELNKMNNSNLNIRHEVENHFPNSYNLFIKQTLFQMQTLLQSQRSLDNYENGYLLRKKLNNLKQLITHLNLYKDHAPMEGDQNSQNTCRIFLIKFLKRMF